MSNEMDNWHRFVWKIENYSFCWHKANECITSPKFYLEGISWSLQLFPRGTCCMGFIACFLKRHTTLNNQVTFKIACLDQDGSSLIEKSLGNRNEFKQNKIAGFDAFVMRRDVFANKRMKFLPNDTLTVCCRISRSQSELCKIFARTCIEVRWETIVGKIPFYIGFDHAVLYNSKSTTVQSVSLQKPIQEIRLSTDEGACSDQNIIIEIFLPTNEQRKFSTCTVFLLDAVGTKLKCGKSENWFDPSKTDQVWKFPLIFTEWELMANKDLYLPENDLHLQFECSFSIGIYKEGIETYDSIDFSTDAENDSVRESSVLEDLGSLISENILCDVNLKTSTKTFPAHKAILSARSPVFKAMFTNDLKEKVTNRVDIEDLDDDTVRRLLMYIYTNTVEELQWQNASQLYVAADKYAIGSLKKKCSSILEMNLCPSNVCEILALVDRHHDAYMKNSVQDYILKHDKDVIDSDEWHDLELKNLQLTAETMSKIYRKAKKF